MRKLINKIKNKIKNNPIETIIIIAWVITTGVFTWYLSLVFGV